MEVRLRTFMEVRLKAFMKVLKKLYASTIENMYASSVNTYASSENTYAAAFGRVISSLEVISNRPGQINHHAYHIIALLRWRYFITRVKSTRMVSGMDAMFSSIFNLCDVRMRIAITCIVPRGCLRGH